VVEGVATATEVSTIGIAYSLVAGLLIYRGGLHWKAVPQMLIPRVTQGTNDIDLIARIGDSMDFAQFS